MKADSDIRLKDVPRTECMKEAETETETCLPKEFGQRVLQLFSGPSNRMDGFAAAIRKAGSLCGEFDMVNGPEQDL